MRKWTDDDGWIDSFVDEQVNGWMDGQTGDCGQKRSVKVHGCMFR